MIVPLAILGVVSLSAAALDQWGRNRHAARRADFIDAMDPLTGRPWIGCPCCATVNPAHAMYCRNCCWFLNPK